jgi:hypothetical protein
VLIKLSPVFKPQSQLSNYKNKKIHISNNLTAIKFKLKKKKKKPKIYSPPPLARQKEE